MELQLRLREAWMRISMGEVALVREEYEMIKQLSRTADGLFDTTTVDDDIYRAARLVYPVYAAYETECNKKEGYPDLLGQIRTLDKKHRENSTLENTADFLCMLFFTIKSVSPQLYEYYRELVDIFKENVRIAINDYFEDGSYGPEGSKADWLIRDVIAWAGKDHVLLAEKYEDYCRGGGDYRAC